MSSVITLSDWGVLVAILAAVFAAIGFVVRTSYRIVSGIESVSRDVHVAKEIAVKLDNDINREETDGGSIRGRLARLELAMIELVELTKELAEERKKTDARLAVVEDRLNIYNRSNFEPKERNNDH